MRIFYDTHWIFKLKRTFISRNECTLKEMMKKLFDSQQYLNNVLIMLIGQLTKSIVIVVIWPYFGHLTAIFSF
jgi:hypothetical protein